MRICASLVSFLAARTIFSTIIALSVGPTSLLAATVDFENMPQSNWFLSGGLQNIGNYWDGVTFGPDATILEDQVYGYSNDFYPQHSGHAVAFSYDLPYIDAVLDTPVDYVS